MVGVIRWQSALATLSVTILVGGQDGFCGGQDGWSGGGQDIF